MRPKLELLAPPHPDKSFLCYPVQVPRFEFYWHYHPEFELTWIEQGHGKRFVGDSVQPFTHLGERCPGRGRVPGLGGPIFFQLVSAAVQLS